MIDIETLRKFKFDGEWQVSSKGGKPPKYKSADELFQRGLDYFEMCIEREQPVTLAGLKLFCGASAAVWHVWSKYPFLADAIETLRQVAEDYYESKLTTGNTSGVVFALKSKFRWKDESTLNVNDNGLADRLRKAQERSRAAVLARKGKAEGE